MRNFISFLLISFFSLFPLFSIQTANASEAGIVSGFEIIAPTTAKVNEAIDITVRAIDKDKKTVTNYNGSIIFISDTFGDVVPSPGKSISFTKEDGGQKKFSKGVTFRSAGKQKIYVADVEHSADIIGEVSVTVEPADAAPTAPSTETVTVVTPANNTQITEDMVVVSGKTKKNSKVVIMLNGQDRGTAVSDDSGLFTKTLSDITQEKNILQVQLLDGTNTVVSRSEDIVFEKVIQKQGFYNIVISPSTTMEASSQSQVLVEGDSGMTGVSIMLDNAVIPLTEKEPGKYIADFVAPAIEGTYPIDVSMKSLTAQAIEKKAVTSIIVTPKAIETPKVEPKFSSLKAVTEGKRVTFEFSLENAPADLDKFKIAYGESPDSLSQEVMTFSSGKIQGTGGVYTWYIDNLEPKNYTFKVFALKSDASLIAGLVSDPVTANVSIPSCTIGNVGDIRVTTENGKSILNWTALTGALSYNVYKVSAAGDHILVQNVKDPKFVVHHSQGEVTYNDFSIKALCAENNESVDISTASQVQTGPGALALLVIISGILGILMLRKKSLS